MVVAAISVLYGISLTEGECVELLEAIISKTSKDYEEVCENNTKYEIMALLEKRTRKSIICILTPHEVRWTNYEGDVIYLGSGYNVDFDTSNSFQFKEYDSDIMNKPLKELFTKVNKSMAETTLQQFFSQKEAHHEIIPTDCNCCS